MSKLIKTRDHLPDWFPLDVYSKELTEHQWLEELVWRLTVKTVFKNTDNKDKAIKLFQELVLDKSLLSDLDKSSLLKEIRPTKELWGVQEIPAFYISYLNHMITSNERGLELSEKIKNIRLTKNGNELFVEPSDIIKNALSDGFGEWVNWEKEPFTMPDVLPSFPVVLDLTQDDETLKLAFDIFLAGIRETLGAAPKPVSHKDFEDWKTYGILPVFDLVFWGELHNIKFTDTLIANFLWPDIDIDNTERLRKVTKPKIKQVLDGWGFVERFWRQLELEESFEDLIKKRNENH